MIVILDIPSFFKLDNISLFDGNSLSLVANENPTSSSPSFVHQPVTIKYLILTF